MIALIEAQRAGLYAPRINWLTRVPGPLNGIVHALTLIAVLLPLWWR